MENMYHLALKHNLYFYEGIYHEDTLWSFQLAVKAESMAVFSALSYSYIYHIRENSISQAVKLKNMDDCIVVLMQIKLIIESDEKLVENTKMLVFFTNLQFAMLQRFSETEFWKYAHRKIKKYL